MIIHLVCCVVWLLAVQLQSIGIGVTTNSPDSGPLPQGWDDINNSDQYWHVNIWRDDCRACHKGQWRLLQWVLDRTAGNTFGCCVSKKGALHLYHNGRDVGVVQKGLPTDQPLWGFVSLCDWKVEANYVIPKGEAVMYGEVVCGVMFVSLNFVHAIVTSRTLRFTWLLCESDRYSSTAQITGFECHCS